ncbi:MAG TPA: hypothetical protein VLE73_02420 [Candidatus Saccharimonadales bacterium]|nr:hypothetical protein [Candidatus Saccharimonadales bacterium]
MLTPLSPEERLLPVGRPEPSLEGLVVVTNGPLPEMLNELKPPAMLGLFIGVSALHRLVETDRVAAVRQMHRLSAAATGGIIREIGIVRCPIESTGLGVSFYGTFDGTGYPDGVHRYSEKNRMFMHQSSSETQARLTRSLGEITTSALRGYFAAQFLANAGRFIENGVWAQYAEGFVPRPLEPITSKRRPLRLLPSGCISTIIRKLWRPAA